MIRSRRGCLTCRKLKRKCDETQPACNACRKRNVTCGGYELKLKWGNGVASRGHLAGFNVPVMNAPAVGVTGNKAPRPHPAATGQESPGVEMGSSHIVFDFESDEAPSSIGSRSAASTNSGNAVMRDDFASDREKFLQFLQSGIDMLYSTQTEDWIKPGLFHMAEQSESLVAMCIALQTYQKREFPRYFEKALNVFQQELSATRDVMQGGTMCAGLLLCTVSILSGEPWTAHLTLMANLYRLHGNLSHLDPGADRYQHHCLEVLGLMDLPGWVIGRQNPRLGFWPRFRVAQTSWEHGIQDGVEIVSGLPRSLLDILARIDDPGSEEALWLWYDSIGEFQQGRLWDATRYAAILMARRRRRHQRWKAQDHAFAQSPHHFRQLQSEPKDVLVPDTEDLLWRAIGALDALRRGQALPENQHLLTMNGISFSYTACCLEVTLLQKHPKWKWTLDCIRDEILMENSRNNEALLQVLGQAWKSGDNDYDIDEAAKALGVEIAQF